MLSWGSQLELARAIWQDVSVRVSLSKIIKASHFERPDLGLICDVIFSEPVGGSPLTSSEIVAKLDDKNPVLKKACEDLLPTIVKAEVQDSNRAIEAGRAFALYQEATIFQGQMMTLVKNGSISDLRNRFEEMLELSNQVVEDEDDIIGASMDSFTSERVEWLWQDFIPLNKIATMEGDGGLGKSTILLDIAARLSTNKLQPGYDFAGESSAPAIIADTIIISAEDNPNDTIRPRLEAAGADLSRIHFFSGVKERSGNDFLERGVALDRDIARLEKYIIRVNAKLVIIDPLVALLGGADFNREQDVRRILKGLSVVAERRRCSIVAIRHLPKNKGDRSVSWGSGSIGVVSAVRSAMIVIKHPSVENARVIAVYKTNIAKSVEQIKPFIYRFAEVEGSQAARIEWVGRTNQTIVELVGGSSQ